MNSLSTIAREIVSKGLSQRTDLELPVNLNAIAREMLRVPEKPASYNLSFPVWINKDIAVPVTGGLDSSVLYFRALNAAEILSKRYDREAKVRAFYVDMGQSYAQKELNALHNLKIRAEVIDLDIKFLLEKATGWKHIIPGRNFLIMSLIAERMNQGGRIYFGAVNGEMPEQGGDKSQTFLRQLNTLFAQLPYPVTVETPLSNETKTDLVSWWKDNKPLDLLDETVSCFDYDSGHCGKCQACLRKWIAYTNNDLVLQTAVDIRIGCAEYITKYKSLMGEAIEKQDFTHYSKRRCEQTLAALEKLNCAQ